MLFQIRSCCRSLPQLPLKISSYIDKLGNFLLFSGEQSIFNSGLRTVRVDASSSFSIKQSLPFKLLDTLFVRDPFSGYLANSKQLFACGTYSLSFELDIHSVSRIFSPKAFQQILHSKKCLCITSRKFSECSIAFPFAFRSASKQLYKQLSMLQ